MQNYFGIIPARAGSKGIPNKNMQLIGDKPMLQYTLEAAKRSKKLDCCILSSNDPEAIALSEQVGIHAPFVRPDCLSEDSSPTEDVILHALEWYKSEFSHFPIVVVLLQPTTPFRTAQDIDNAIRNFEQTEKESLVSVCQVSQHPSDCIILLEDKSIKKVPLHINKKKNGRQSYQKVYFIDGGVYISTIKRFLKENTMFDNNSEIFEVSKSHGLDIDDFLDLELARAMIHYNQTTNNNIFKY